MTLPLRFQLEQLVVSTSSAHSPRFIWVGSPLYVTEVSAQTADDAERRLEQLARALEEGKPYLLSAGVGQIASTLRQFGGRICGTGFQQSLHQSMQRVLTKIAMLLPGIVAFYRCTPHVLCLGCLGHIHRPAIPDSLTFQSEAE